LPKLDTTWEFFYAMLGPGKGAWGWRKRLNGQLVEASVTYFSSFFECHQDAKVHGLEGEIQFATPNPEYGALPIGIVPAEMFGSKKN
jgi:hypothetical protein